MTPLACPKCRQAVSDNVLDAGDCPCCGYDGAMVSHASPKGAWLVATIAVVGIGLGVSAFLLAPRPTTIRYEPKLPFAVASPAEPQPPTPLKRTVAPAPRPIVLAATRSPTVPPAAIVPKRNPSNPTGAPLGPVLRIDAKDVREKAINRPDGVLLVSDMNRDDRLTLTGRVRVLKIGTVGGNATLDASGLEAAEIVVTGDVNGHARVMLNAPGGRVTIGGLIEGSARLTVTAPGGAVAVVARSGGFEGDSRIAVVARDVDVIGRMSGRAKLLLTLTGGGTTRIGVPEEQATVIYK